MASSLPSSSLPLFRTLSQHLSSSSPSASSILSTSLSLLTLSSTLSLDPLLLRLASIAAFHENQIEKALELLEKKERKNIIEQDPHLKWCYAYALYRNKKHQQALEILSSLSSSSSSSSSSSISPSALAHLSAQASYKAGLFLSSSSSYLSSFPLSSILADGELLTNLLAAQISASQIKEALKLLNETLKLPSPAATLTSIPIPSSSSSLPLTYELAYNISCVFLESGDLMLSYRWIQKSLSLCQQMLKDEGAKEDEIENESATLKVQQAYILQSFAPPFQSIDKSLALYNSVLSLKPPPSDTAALAVASNNLITLRSSHEKIFDSLKKSHRSVVQSSSTMEGTGEEKLNSRQRQQFGLNRALLLIRGKQWKKAKEVLEVMKKEFSKEIRPILVEAEMIRMEGKGKKEKEKEAEMKIVEFIERMKKEQNENKKKEEDDEKDSSVLEAQLSLIQLSLFRADYLSAFHLLSSLHLTSVQLRYRPGLLATLLSLKEKIIQEKNNNNNQEKEEEKEEREEEEIKKAEKENVELLKKGIEYWREREKEKARGGGVNVEKLKMEREEAAKNLSLLLEQSAEYCSQHHRYAEATEFLRQLVNVDSISKNNSTHGSASDNRTILGLCKLIQATAHLSASEAAEQSKSLPPLNLSGIDVMALESTPAPELARKKRATTTVAVGSSEKEKEKVKTKTKKKKKRSKRLPKNFDPTNPGPLPDPERWLPKWERSTFKKNKKGGKGGGNAATERSELRGAQGSSNAEAAKNFDLVKRKEEEAARAAAEAASGIVSGKEQKSGNVISAVAKKAANKKKGKKKIGF